MANPLHPPNLGFRPVPNLVLPQYILTEVVTVRDVHGVVHLIRRPRPLSLITGATVVLQSDQELLRQ